jgi:histidine triad (HIT) family protein
MRLRPFLPHRILSRMARRVLSLQRKSSDMPTLFSRIVSGELPSYKIAEDDRFFAFLDIYPLRPGHTLVVPKAEVDRFFDMPSEHLNGILAFAKPIVLAIERSFPCQRCGISVIGLEVPHAHLHLVPIDSADDLNFTRPKMRLSEAEMAEARDRILSNLRP